MEDCGSDRRPAAEQGAVRRGAGEWVWAGERAACEEPVEALGWDLSVLLDCLRTADPNLTRQDEGAEDDQEEEEADAAGACAASAVSLPPSRAALPPVLRRVPSPALDALWAEAAGRPAAAAAGAVLVHIGARDAGLVLVISGAVAIFAANSAAAGAGRFASAAMAAADLLAARAFGEPAAVVRAGSWFGQVTPTAAVPPYATQSRHLRGGTLLEVP